MNNPLSYFQFQLLLALLFLMLTQLNRLARCSSLEANKVVIHRPAFAHRANFGFSVAGYQMDNDSWILVGAPLTMRDRFQHSSGSGSTPLRSKEGAVYRCRVNVANSCYMLPFDKKQEWSEARDQHGFYYSENKTDQLLGATLLVEDDTILACAPNYRYVTRILRTPDHDFRHEPTGTCFTLRDKMRKFEEHSPCRNGKDIRNLFILVLASFEFEFSGSGLKIFLIELVRAKDFLLI